MTNSLLLMKLSDPFWDFKLGNWELVAALLGTKMN